MATPTIPTKSSRTHLDTELERVVSFYKPKENEIYAELNALLKDGYNEENENAPHGR